MASYPTLPLDVKSGDNPTLAQALRIAARGWRVFPLHPVRDGGICGCVELYNKPCDAKPGKHPMIGAWQHNATTDAGWIRSWWGANPERGIGIATGEQSGLLVVDVDRENAQTAALIAHFNGGPRVRTARGTHYYFRYPTDGSVYQNSASLLADGLDIRGKGGYVVAPGSVHAFGQRYVELVSIETQLGDAPEELLSLIRKNVTTQPSLHPGAGLEIGGVPTGQHDAFFASVAGFLRGRWGLSQDAIRAALEQGPLAALVGYDPSRPYTATDYDRIARSAAQYTATNTAGGITFVDPSALDVRCASELGAYTPPPWLITDLLPAYNFTAVFGPPGAGKSSLLGYMMAALTSVGHSVLYIVDEDPNEAMKARILAGNGNVDRTFYLPKPEDVFFPAATDALFTIAKQMSCSLVVVDTLFDHIEEGRSQYKAPEVRPLLRRIQAKCLEHKIAFVGGYHTNQSGQPQASTAFREVPRNVLRVHSFQPDSFEVAIYKLNGRRRPGYSLRFAMHGAPIAGSTETIGIAICLGQSANTAEDMQSDFVDRAVGKRAKKDDGALFKVERIKELLTDGTERTANQIWREVGGGRNSTLALIQDIKRDMELHISPEAIKS